MAVNDNHLSPVSVAIKEVSVEFKIKGSSKDVRALNNISLVVHHGESVGIVGQNGSGKSTLLRVISGALKPTSGIVRASSTPILLGVNAALQPELSGRANVRIGCLAMGMSPGEADAAFEEIIALADIGEAIDRPMKTYSSGMGARLRFAIATAARPDILLIDEALNTGDAAFKARGEERIAELRADAGTIFLVSHAAQTVENLCSRAVWLNKGDFVLDGPAREVARKYRWWAWKVAHKEHDIADKLLADAKEEGMETLVSFYDQRSSALRRGVPRHLRRSE